MNAETKKRWRVVILRSAGALSFGWLAVMACAVLLSRYGLAPDDAFLPRHVTVARFPENEKMLNDLTAKLAHDGAALSKVEPASGQKKK